MKRLFMKMIYVAAVASVMMLAGCVKEYREGTSMRIDDNSDREVTVGDTVFLKAIISPADESSTVVWGTTDENVAKVVVQRLVDGKADRYVMVLANTPGEAKVYVTVNGTMSDTCKIKVNGTPIDPASVTLNKKEITLEQGWSDTLTYKVEPEDANVTSVKWSVSAGNDSTAAISQDGVVVGLKPGETWVCVSVTSKIETSTVKSEVTVKDSCKVTVQEKRDMRVAVLLPTKSSEFYLRCGSFLKDSLEKEGCQVSVFYAEDDEEKQITQMEGVIADGFKNFIIAPINEISFPESLFEKSPEMNILCFSRLIMNNKWIDAYVSKDSYGIGKALGQCIVDSLNASSKQSMTIEILSGSPDDNDALLLYNGEMEILKSYFDNGKLVCKTGRTSFEKTCILRWSQETAQQWMENYLSGFYADGKLNIVLSAFDGFAYGAKAALEGAGYRLGVDWPIITGVDCEVKAMKNIKAGSQSLTFDGMGYYDMNLASKGVKTMLDLIFGRELKTTRTYNNHSKDVPFIPGDVKVIDINNLPPIPEL